MGDLSSPACQPAAFFWGTPVQTIDVGATHTCVSTGSGAAYCWGFNTDGQLGDGTRVNALDEQPARVLDPR